MKPIDHLVERPLPIFLGAALVTLLGVWCLLELPVARNPHVVVPYSIVVVPYSGATPDELEAEVTIELEKELNAVDRLRHITSVSSEGVSTHILEFEDRTDMSDSLQAVRDKARLAEVEFPDDAGDAVVREMLFDDLPIVFFTLSGGDDLFRLRKLAEGLKPALEGVSGVSRVEIFGGHEPEVRVLVDPPRLSQHGLTLADIEAAIWRQSRNLPAGQLRSQQSELQIRSTGEFQQLEAILSMVVASERGRPVTLRDVARVELTHERLATGSWINAEPSVTLIVRRRSDINTLETVDRLKAQVENYRSELPPDVRIDATSSSAELIGVMIRQLGVSGVVGLVLILGVLFVMFGVRQALLVSCVLPFAFLFTFIGLYVFEMAITNVALFALILVLGLVVDGAIIVGEAIFREREAGKPSAEAARLGLARVGLPVIAADLTTVAAFLPMLLMVGVMGQFMSVLPKVVIFALLGSIFVDHLLLPAAAARLGVRRRAVRRRLAPDGLPWFSPELPRARRLYLRVLEAALRHRSTVVALAAGAFGLALLLLTTGAIRSIFLPMADRGRLTVNYALPAGTSLSETGRVGHLIAREIAELSEVKTQVLTTGDTGALNSDIREGSRRGPQYGRITVELVDKSDRLRSQAEIVTNLRSRISHYAGVEIDIDELGEGPPVGAALAIRVQGRGLEHIDAVARAVEERVSALPTALDVQVDYDRSKPEIRVDLDRLRAAAEFGISPDQVSRTLLAAFHGVEVGRMWVGSERVDIRLQASDAYAHTIENVRELTLRANSGEIVPLGVLADVRYSFTHNAIFRHDTLRTATVRADATAGSSSVALEAAARSALEDLALPSGIRLVFGGESEERDRSYASLWSALKWGLLLIFFIMAVQFNSIAQPLIVLLSIPLSVVGVVLGLLVTGTPFSFMVFIGVVSLTGIVVNDGIVLIDAINRNRREGMPLANAIRDAALRRFRPVLLTTVTTICGLLPLTLNIARGSEFWVPLGIAIISGLLVASMLTLVFVPVLYSILEESRPRWMAARAAVRSGSHLGAKVATT